MYIQTVRCDENFSAGSKILSCRSAEGWLGSFGKKYAVALTVVEEPSVTLCRASLRPEPNGCALDHESGSKRSESY